MSAMTQISLRALGLLLAGLIGLPSAMAAPPPAPFFNGFELPGDIDAGDNMTGATRVASGTNGITSAAGAWHAEAPAGSFTRYGGYSAVFPAGGFTTSIDIYLDLAKSLPGQDKRFDWSSAISNPAGSHRRDFVFSVGTNGAGGYVMSVSNTTPGWPANPGRDPLTVTSSGWYTFVHSFHDNGSGVLAVDMSVLSGATVLKTWTLSDPSDVIGSTVGGSRYGWLVTNALGNLPIDNLTRSGLTLNDRKQQVRDDLAALLPSGNKNDDKHIEKAIESLDKSLRGDRWVDDDTLAAKDGKKVFDEEAKAAEELLKVRGTDVSALLLALVDIDAQLASGAIADAQAAYDNAGCPSTLTSDCKKAADELDKAAKEMTDAAAAYANVDYVKAIQEYRKAWTRADKALKQLG